MRVHVFMHDIHLLDRVASDRRVTTAAEILWNRDAYNSLFRKRTILRDGTVTMRPLRDELYHNHFWRFFANTWIAPDNSDHWARHIPLIWQDEKISVRVTAPHGEYGVRDHNVNTHLLLWPLGWSSNLSLTWSGSVSAFAFAKWFESIRHRRTRMFALNGEAATLSGIFMALQASLERWLKNGNVVAKHRLAVNRRVVVSVIEVDQNPVPAHPHRTGEWGGRRLLTDQERAALLSTLHGGQVTLLDLAGNSPRSKHMVTHLEDFDFVLTNFDLGSLCFLADSFQTGAKSESSLWCLGSNVQTTWIMGELLSEIARNTNVGRTRAGEDLQGAATELVQNLHSHYFSPFCRDFFNYHSLIAQMVGKG